MITKKIFILQEVEITVDYIPKGQTEKDVLDYAISVARQDAPRIDHRSKAGYSMKSVKNSVKIFS